MFSQLGSWVSWLVGGFAWSSTCPTLGLGDRRHFDVNGRCECADRCLREEQRELEGVWFVVGTTIVCYLAWWIALVNSTRYLLKAIRQKQQILGGLPWDRTSPFKFRVMPLKVCLFSQRCVHTDGAR